MKTVRVLPLILVLVLSSFFAAGSVFAQSVGQVTSVVNLSHLNIQLTYPSQVFPNESATVDVTAQAEDTFLLSSLTMQVYLAGRNNLVQLLSGTLAQNTLMQSGDQLNKQVQLTVPSDAGRASLVAQLTESVGSYSNLYPYSYPSTCFGTVCSVGSYPYAYPYYYYNLPSVPYYYYYNQNYYQTTSQATPDYAITALSYVLAPTPEYAALQTQYQQLQNQNQQLRQQLQTLQNSTAQKDSTISNLTNQLYSAQGTTTLAEIVAVVLAIALVAVAALHLKSRRTGTEAHSAP